MRLVPLGINGFIPTFGRHTTSFLVLSDDNAILLDAGTGVARLFEPEIADLLLPYRELNIILSHYHLDHIIGLSYLAGLQGDMSICIYAPAQPLVESNPDDSLRALLHEPFFSLPLENFRTPVRIVPIKKCQFDIGNLPVSVRAQTHPGGSIGVRLADLVFMTDTVVDEKAIPFMSRAELLLHEVWLGDEDIKGHENDLLAHSDASGVVKLALAAEVKHVMPIHLHPRKTGDDIDGLIGNITVAGVQARLPIEGQLCDIRIT